MKRKQLTQVDPHRVASLADILSKLQDAGIIEQFLYDICTSAELESISDRWRVVPLLMAGHSYRDIASQTGISVTTVGRVAKTIAEGRGGYNAAHNASKSR